MAKKGYQTLTMIWRDVAITVEYNDDWSKSYEETYGSKLTHTNIQRDDGTALPITSSGYRSHFMDSSHLDNYESILDYVRQWLDHEAQSKTWKAYVTDRSQLKLF